VARELKLTPSESVEVKRSSAELLEVEATYGPGGKPAPPHFHPAQAERFEVLEGSVQSRVGGRERELLAGEVLEIPAGEPHQMWNSAGVPARVRWETKPGLRTEEWFSAIDRLHREGKVGRNGMPGPLAFGVLLSEFDDVFRLAVKPAFLVRPTLAVLGALGRARGGYLPR